MVPNSVDTQGIRTVVSILTHLTFELLLGVVLVLFI